MKRGPRYELWAAAAVMAAAGGGYVLAAADGPPRPGGPLGLSLAAAGLALMLWAEVGYTLRKRLRRFQRGSMRFWLRVHIFAGLAGAFLALLHSGGRFHGLAGILAWFTLLIVLSGLVGRFLYTSIPRTLEGAELSLPHLLAECARTEQRLRACGLAPDDPLFEQQVPAAAWLLLLGQGPFQWARARAIRRRLRQLPGGLAGRREEVAGLLEARYSWLLEIRLLIACRRLLALWHAFHVPLGLVLFTLAAIHVAGALYYASILAR